MSAEVKCVVCGKKLSTANVRTGYAGYCSCRQIYWHSKCHTVKQCPLCNRYTK